MPKKKRTRKKVSVLGRNLRFHRQFSEMTQTELARRIGVAPAYISQIESDLRTPSIRVAEAMALELSVPLAALINDETELSQVQKINALRAVIADLKEAI